MFRKSYKPFEELEKDDIGTTPPGRTNAYQLMAKTCFSNTSSLQQSATIQRLTSNCRMHDNIVKYVTNSSGGKNITVKTVYKIKRKNERDPFQDSYRIMLWHGTSPSAVPGIIQTGFRMGSGGLFGGGIYFADRIAKSSVYTSRSVDHTYFFILAEIAPGTVYKAHYFHTEYKKPPTGFDSVKGMGSQIPNWKENKDYGGAIFPCGATKQNERHSQYDMTWNEYIVYDPNQIIVRFVVECQM